MPLSCTQPFRPRATVFTFGKLSLPLITNTTYRGLPTLALVFNPLHLWGSLLNGSIFILLCRWVSRSKGILSLPKLSSKTCLVFVILNLVKHSENRRFWTQQMVLICWGISSTLTFLIKFPTCNLSERGWIGVSQPGFHIKMIWGSFKIVLMPAPYRRANKSELLWVWLRHSNCYISTLDDSNVQQELKKAKFNKGLILYGVKNSTETNRA